MSKKPEFRPKDYDKFHQKRKLEMIVRECKECGRETVFIYVGVERFKHYYQCLVCDNYISGYSKLK